jgi:hypothetical protein
MDKSSRICYVITLENSFRTMENENVCLVMTDGIMDIKNHLESPSIALAIISTSSSDMVVMSTGGVLELVLVD